MTLQPDKKSLRWESNGTAWGEPLETRKNALLRVARHKGTAIATFTVPRVCELPQLAQLDEELRDLVEKYEIKYVVLNFAPLGFMSSSVVSILVRFQTMVKAAGGALVLCSMPEPIDEVFTVMHLHKHFSIQKDERDALKALRKQS
jgi:anti-anti-sigma factor